MPVAGERLFVFMYVAMYLCVQELRVRTSAEAAIPGPVEELRGWAISHEKITLEWKSPVVTNGQITEYRLASPLLEFATYSGSFSYLGSRLSQL